MNNLEKDNNELEMAKIIKDFLPSPSELVFKEKINKLKQEIINVKQKLKKQKAKEMIKIFEKFKKENKENPEFQKFPFLQTALRLSQGTRARPEILPARLPP